MIERSTALPALTLLAPRSLLEFRVEAPRRVVVVVVVVVEVVAVLDEPTVEAEPAVARVTLDDAGTLLEAARLEPAAWVFVLAVSPAVRARDAAVPCVSELPLVAGAVSVLVAVVEAVALLAAARSCIALVSRPAGAAFSLAAPIVETPVVWKRAEDRVETVDLAVVAEFEVWLDAAAVRLVPSMI